MRAFRWALGPSQIPRRRSEVYVPTTRDRYSKSALRLSHGRPYGAPFGTCLSLGFGTFPAAPPLQRGVLSPHNDRLTELVLRLSQGRPIGFH